MSKQTFYIVVVSIAIFFMGIRIGIDYTVKNQRISNTDTGYQIEILNEVYEYESEE